MSKLSPVEFVQLRQRIQALDGSRRAAGVLPFGIAAIDDRLPGGGLALGALHEVAGHGDGVVDGAAASLFAAGIAARTTGKVLWCVTQSDLFAPGLAQAGLSPDRVIHVEAGDEKTLLACCEEALRHGGLGAVVGEVAKLPMLASRRLQLAAEDHATLCLLVRRWKQVRDAAEFGQPTSATTRWCVAAAPSAPLPVPGIGRARWDIELMRCKGGEAARFTVEACDEKGRLALPAALVHRPAAAQLSLRAAS
ncbi:MAG: damage-inducible protein [Asticcacaulis sp.]|nr:damage-inducible protein [Asticcacaulis sp.]